MRRLAPGVRALGLLALLLASGAGSAPVLAAPDDVALLKSYIGTWRGRGTLTGANVETVVCRLTLAEGNRDMVNYNGRCTLAGTQLSIAGTVAYVEANKRYEAAMSSNAKFGGRAIGQKRGGNVIFTMHERDKDEAGKDLDISAQMKFSQDAIHVVFDVVYVDNGDSLRAEVPFSR
ncbi:hypothetical protein [Devosia aquimaris]|uniref:hypothetical protein n=1 Tax=Devosia aquimaris TaxID=2866214 RepID=UPI001CD05D7B|nr:hypothetical protein [Devosia sp. CJK-A8-3]